MGAPGWRPSRISIQPSEYLALTLIWICDQQDGPIGSNLFLSCWSEMKRQRKGSERGIDEPSLQIAWKECVTAAGDAFHNSSRPKDLLLKRNRHIWEGPVANHRSRFLFMIRGRGCFNNNTPSKYTWVLVVVDVDVVLNSTAVALFHQEK